MTTSERAGCAPERVRRPWECSAHLHRLLSEREPAFLATLRAAERQVDAELSRDAGGPFLLCHGVCHLVGR